MNEIAYATLQQAIGAKPKEQLERKNEPAKLGRKGGLKGGAARAKAMSKARRAEIAKKAAQAMGMRLAVQPLDTQQSH